MTEIEFVSAFASLVIITAGVMLLTMGYMMKNMYTQFIIGLTLTSLCLILIIKIVVTK